MNACSCFLHVYLNQFDLLIIHVKSCPITALFSFSYFSLVSGPGWQHTWSPDYQRLSLEYSPSWMKHNHHVAMSNIPLQGRSKVDIQFKKNQHQGIQIGSNHAQYLVVIRALWLADPSEVSIQEAPRRTYIGRAPGKGVAVHSHAFPIMSYNPWRRRHTLRTKPPAELHTSQPNLYVAKSNRATFNYQYHHLCFLTFKVSFACVNWTLCRRLIGALLP